MRKIEKYFETEYLTLLEFLVAIILSIFFGIGSHNYWIGILMFFIMILNFRILRLMEKNKEKV